MCADLVHTPSEVEFEENWVVAFDRKEGKGTFQFPPWVLARAVKESRRSWARPAWPGGQGCTQPGGPLSLSACQAHDLPEVSRRLFSSPQSMSLTQESLLSRSSLSRKKKAQGSTQWVETLLLVIIREGIQLRGRSSGEGAPLTPNVPGGAGGHGRGRARRSSGRATTGPVRQSAHLSPRAGLLQCGTSPHGDCHTRQRKSSDGEDAVLLTTPAVLIHKTSALTSTHSYFDPSSWP